jgi:hypothetical protein
MPVPVVDQLPPRPGEDSFNDYQLWLLDAYGGGYLTAEPDPVAAPPDIYVEPPNIGGVPLPPDSDITPGPGFPPYVPPPLPPYEPPIPGSDDDLDVRPEDFAPPPPPDTELTPGGGWLDPGDAFEPPVHPDEGPVDRPGDITVYPEELDRIQIFNPGVIIAGPSLALPFPSFDRPGSRSPAAPWPAVLAGTRPTPQSGTGFPIGLVASGRGAAAPRDLPGRDRPRESDLDPFLQGVPGLLREILRRVLPKIIPKRAPRPRRTPTPTRTPRRPRRRDVPAPIRRTPIPDPFRTPQWPYDPLAPPPQRAVPLPPAPRPYPQPVPRPPPLETPTPVPPSFPVPEPYRPTLPPVNPSPGPGNLPSPAPSSPPSRPGPARRIGPTIAPFLYPFLQPRPTTAQPFVSPGVNPSPGPAPGPAPPPPGLPNPLTPINPGTLSFAPPASDPCAQQARRRKQRRDRCRRFRTVVVREHTKRICQE